MYVGGISIDYSTAAIHQAIHHFNSPGSHHYRHTMSSLITAFSNKLADPWVLSMLGAVASSSYHFFGNLGAATFGIMPALWEKEGAGSLSVDTRVRLWKWYFDVAKVGISIAVRE